MNVIPSLEEEEAGPDGPTDGSTIDKVVGTGSEVTVLENAVSPPTTNALTCVGNKCTTVRVSTRTCDADHGRYTDE